AIFLRRPRTGTRSSVRWPRVPPWEKATAEPPPARSSRRMRPWGPVPRIVARLIPFSRAAARTAGAACGSWVSLAGGPRTGRGGRHGRLRCHRSGRRLRGSRSGGFRGRSRSSALTARAALEAHHDLPHFGGLAFFQHQLAHGAAELGGDLHGGFVGHHFEDHLV